jgi:hypothetical protein
MDNLGGRYPMTCPTSGRSQSQRWLK